MKLYATVTSERASKGQGGEWLDIVITVENPYTKERHTFRTINVRERKCSDSTSYTVDNGGDEYIDCVTFNKGQKGEKQKDVCEVQGCTNERKENYAKCAHHIKLGLEKLGL